MDPNLTRWEWRAFGQDLGAAERQLASSTALQVQESEEVYLLGSGSDANVKIRHQLMDIKHLEEVDGNGLERWQPVLKEPFPLSALAVARVRSALGLPEEPAPGGSLSLAAVPGALAPAGGPVHLVSVRKTRTRYTFQGCAAEVTSLVADGKTARTVALEDVDPAKVMAAVRALGLEGCRNTSYPRGLKELTGISSQGEPT